MKKEYEVEKDVETIKNERQEQLNSNDRLKYIIVGDNTYGIFWCEEEE